MIQYALTGLAGLALGLVIMRLIRFAPALDMTNPDGDELSMAGLDDQKNAAPAVAGGWSSSRKFLAGAGMLGLVAAALILFRAPDAGKQAGASPPVALGAAAKSLDDVDTMISRLANRLESNPADGEGFRMLGWSYVMTGHPEKAIAPYKRALALLPANALVHSGYGEALVGIASDTVTDEARSHFDKALAIDAKEPRALYFAALWLAQHGKEKEALDQWVALANAAPSDASWQADLRSRIGSTAKKLGVDVSSRLKAVPTSTALASTSTAMTGGALPSAIEPPPLDPETMRAAGSLPPAERQAMIDGMVEGLAKRLRDNPRDAEGWARLLRSRVVLGQAGKAAAELKVARASLKSDPDTLARLNAAVANLGISGS